MEESSKPHSMENKASQEKYKKRQHKTPTQLNALEKFYNEHEYPTEEMKSDLAVELGLSEKQISGWFCHRRLKEKKLRDEVHGNGKQDRSSGIIQDREFGQDSCGSTKHGDYKHCDPREVESQGVYDHGFPATDLAYDRRSNPYTENICGMDNTSSESSSFLQDKLHYEMPDPYNMIPARYFKDDEDLPPINSMGRTNIGYKPSGYLKVKGEIENAAITAVKKQLGRNYREDGPLLAVEFDQLPPGAFGSSVGNPIHESYYIENPIVPHPTYISAAKREIKFSSRYEYNAKNSSNEPTVGGENLILDSDFQEKKSHQHIKKRSPFLNHTDPVPAMNSSDMYEDDKRYESGFNSKKGRGMSSKHSIDGMRSDSASYSGGHHYGEKAGTEQPVPLLHGYDDASTKVRDGFTKLKPSSLMHSRHVPVDMEDRGRSLRTEKDNFSGERKGMKVYDDSVKGRKHLTKESKIAKVAKVGLPPRDWMKQIPAADFPPLQKLRSATEMPTSFSEDETAETSSSLD